MTNLVLIGGGHAHVEVIRRWRLAPIKGVQLVVISADNQTPYSGMIPGVIAGIYNRSDAYIDLPTLCNAPSIQFIKDSVTAFNKDDKQVRLASGCDIAYDFASINTGVTPTTALIADNNGEITPVKPIDDFYRALEQQKRFFGTSTDKHHIYIVGGGAASCEIASTLKWQIDRLNKDNNIQWVIIAPMGILPEYHNNVRRLVQRNLKEQGISILKHRVTKARNNTLILDDGSELTSTWTIWALPGVAAPFIQQSDLAHNDRGELRVDEYLRVLNEPNVFGAGDCIDFNAEHLRKTGVYPVRQGPILDANIRASIEQTKPLEPFKPRKTLLNILLLNPEEAVLSYGPIAAKGHWVLKLKDKIDRRFMRRYEV